jgi:tripartite-type tricarboxylate transporter receptor subunit TctC
MKLVRVEEVNGEVSVRKMHWVAQLLYKSFLFVNMVFLGLLSWNLEAQGAEYPSRPITMMIGMPAGGTIDVVVRALIPEVSKILGQELIPVNKSGGGGAVPVGILANTEGDGYTISAQNSSALTNAPHLEAVSYNPLTDITPIIQFGVLIPIYVVRSDSPFNSFKELVEFAKKNPGKVSLGHTGVGTVPHLVMELVKLEEKVNIITVPFAGGPPAMAALLGGHVTVCGTSINSAMSNIRAGKIKAIGITAGKRAAALPNVPTLAEQGFPYGVLIEMYLILGPKGMAPPVVKKLENAFREAMKTQAFKDFVNKFNLYEENPLSGDALKEWVKGEYVKSGEIIKRANIGK